MWAGRKSLVARGKGIQAHLVGCAPGLEQPIHAHDHHLVSIVLAGEVWDEAFGRRQQSDFRRLVIKPAGTLHRSWCGRNGALLLSFSLEHAMCASVMRRGWRWSTPSAASIAAVMRAVADGVMAEELMTNLVERAEGPDRAVTDAPPSWLVAVAQCISEDSATASIAELAAASGVHRVHLSRTFARVYGTTIREFRQRCRLSRSIAEIAFGEANLTAIAHDAGYADESHLSRSMRRYVGLPTGEVRRRMQSAIGDRAPALG